MHAEWRATSAEQAEAFQQERNKASVAVLDWQRDEQIKRRALEDRLATADLRLSVLLGASVTGGSSGVREASGSSSMVHGGTRAELDPAHAQRIVAITGDGDDGLIALQVCQAYMHKARRAWRW
uniref:lysis protein n=1 Tax=Pseudomonas laurentiana TaxID=2364649 RepID=UPI0029C87968|nr:lysis protein [Pseudomonas laurentiana]